MRLKVKDLKVGDQVFLRNTTDHLTRPFIGSILEITRITEYKAWTNENFHNGDQLWLRDSSDDFICAVPYINEQKLKAKLGLK